VVLDGVIRGGGLGIDAVGCGVFPDIFVGASCANPGWDWEDRATPIMATAIAIRRAKLIEAINRLMSVTTSR
jgi:hypothetical protein